MFNFTSLMLIYDSAVKRVCCFAILIRKHEPEELNIYNPEGEL